jgi:threonine dehydratase
MPAQHINAHIRSPRERQITLDSIRDAARHVHRAARRTPLVQLDIPGETRVAAGADRPLELYLKLETLQPIGSFKIRGAYNAIRQLSPVELRQGVWTVSSGNAAQAVALAARLMGAPCSVMVIETAAETKIRAIEALGAQIVRVSWDEAWDTAQRGTSQRMKGTFVHPFDDDRFISGNGTIGLEIVEDLPDVDAVVAPLGGGGLISGIACAVRTLRPQARVFAAEPATAAPLSHSLAAGRPEYFPDWQASFVDGAGGKSVIPTMWPLLSQWLAGSVVVTLDEVGQAIKTVADRVHVIAEGAAGCAAAAALSGKVGGGKVVAVISGGNIDLTTFGSVVGACP